MKASGKCVVIVQNTKGEFWQVALDKKGMSFVLSALEQYFNGSIKILDNQLYGISFGEKSKKNNKSNKKTK